MKSAFHSILELSNNQQLDIQFSSVQLSLFGHITYYIEQNENKKKKSWRIAREPIRTQGVYGTSTPLFRKKYVTLRAYMELQRLYTA